MLTKLKTLGPGLLYAGAAIGVSHLVQSTKAGAIYGYTLIIAIVLAHFFKYPFFILGPRYAASTGKSLVEGFASLGKWATGVLLLVTLGTMFAVQAAVTIVTAGLIQKMFATHINVVIISGILLALSFGILQLGKLKFLDKLMKVTIILLAISTLVAFGVSWGVRASTISYIPKFHFGNPTDLAFLIAFIGWMPAPLDLTVWHSIWSAGTTQNRASSDFDFKVGFYGTAVLGVCFLTLGAHTLYSSGIDLQSSAGGFASQLIDVFTTNLGEWSYWFILIAAVTAMFSTTLTCFDAMPRVMSQISNELNISATVRKVAFWRIVLVGGSMVILVFLAGSMKQMVNFATSISFLTAPIIALMCYKLHLEKSELNLWSTNEKRLAIIGIVALTVFSSVYIYSLLS